VRPDDPFFTDSSHRLAVTCLRIDCAPRSA
jgi:hypothetical protein